MPDLGGKSSKMATPNSSVSKPHIPALTGMRAVAAYLVFLHHYPFFKQNSFWWKIVGQFHVGISIFFVISGFVIAYNYQATAELSSKFFKHFFKMRFARIYPLYLFVLVLTFWNDHGVDWFSFFINASLLKGFLSDYSGLKWYGIAQAWTLTPEETFYASAPFIFVFLKKFQFKLRSYFFVLFAAWVIALALGKLGTTIQWHGLFGTWEFVAFYTFFGRAFEFILGCFLARAFLTHQNSTSEKTPQVFHTMMGIGFVGFVFTLHKMSNASPTLNIFLNNLVLPIFVGLFLYGLVQSKSILNRILGNRVFVLLGKSSYAFYLVHKGVFAYWISPWIGNMNLGLPAMCGIYFIVLNAISIGLYVAFEQPVNRIIRKIQWRTLSITDAHKTQPDAFHTS